MRFPICAILVAPVLILAGCGGDLPGGRGLSGPNCEEASARAVAPGTADAKLFALISLKYEVQDLKGFLLKNGYRSVHARPAKVACSPYQIGIATGLKACVATAQLCER
jgi:hypothetical protein